MPYTSENNPLLKAAWKTYTIAQQCYSAELRQREAAFYAINHPDLLLEMINGQKPFSINGISFNMKILKDVVKEKLKKS
jgi:hypothetical protein